MQADLSDVARIPHLFQQGIEHFGRLDIVVTNAGNARWGAVAELAEEDYDFVFRLNAKGTFFALQEAARRIADGGRIVNVTSSATALSIPGLGVYVGSKAAGEQFAKTLARELGPCGITVNNVSPGFTETDMLPENAEFEAWQRTCPSWAGLDSRPISRASWRFWRGKRRGGLRGRTSRLAAA